MDQFSNFHALFYQPLFNIEKKAFPLLCPITSLKIGNQIQWGASCLAHVRNQASYPMIWIDSINVLLFNQGVINALLDGIVNFANIHKAKLLYSEVAHKFSGEALYPTTRSFFSINGDTTSIKALTSMGFQSLGEIFCWEIPTDYSRSINCDVTQEHNEDSAVYPLLTTQFRLEEGNLIISWCPHLTDSQLGIKIINWQMPPTLNIHAFLELGLSHFHEMGFSRVQMILDPSNHNLINTVSSFGGFKAYSIMRMGCFVQ